MHLLKDIGLIMEVDDGLFVQFAREIESQFTNLDDDIVVQKSNTLVNCLLTRQDCNQLLDRIKDISFVIPS